jgi:2-polyprenyl-6-methoxyphenol hydroxylase-like FAD-dependent oxidoreductase
VEDINWRTVVQFERRLAACHGKGRMWLAGDAAHLTAPAGMQSLNLGLFEARDLSCTLARVLRGTPVAELDAYSAKWQSEWRRLHGIEGGLRADATTDPWIAEQAGRLLPCLPAHGNVVNPLAKQLGLSML